MTQTYRFRVGCGAPAQDLAEMLVGYGFSPSAIGACEELGDYCVICGTDAQIENLCDDIGGMAMALDPRPEGEVSLPDWLVAPSQSTLDETRLGAAAQDLCDAANAAEIRGQAAMLAFADARGAEATDYDADGVALFVPTGIESPAHEEFILVQDSRGQWGVFVI
jgi:hypothetical protein